MSNLWTMLLPTRLWFVQDDVRNEWTVCCFLLKSEIRKENIRFFSNAPQVMAGVKVTFFAGGTYSGANLNRFRGAWHIRPTGQPLWGSRAARRAPLHGSGSFYTFCCITVKDNQHTHRVSDYRVSKQQAFHFMTLSSALPRPQVSATNFEECAHVLTRY